MGLRRSTPTKTGGVLSGASQKSIREPFSQRHAALMKAKALGIEPERVTNGCRLKRVMCVRESFFAIEMFHNPQRGAPTLKALVLG